MAKPISFASFNLYNFQYKGEKVYKRVIPEDEYNNKVKWVRAQLIALNADVVALQELWDKRCLEDVLADTPELADYQPYYLADNWYNIAVAALVRKPWRVKSKKVIKKFPFTNLNKVDQGDGEDDEVEVKIEQFSRSILRLKLEHTDSATTPDVMAFCCHLKSKLHTDIKKGIPEAHKAAVGAAISTIRRTAEAAALRWILNKHMKGSNSIPTVVLGDLNDDPRSNTVAILTEQPTLQSSATGADEALYSALQLHQLKSFRDVYYTHEFNDQRDAIDHILVSEEFFEHSRDKRWRLKDVKIWNDHIHNESREQSDHGLITAYFV